MMKYQLNNGSLFNSPSATAAVLIHHPDANGLQYLQSVLQNLENAGNILLLVVSIVTVVCHVLIYFSFLKSPQLIPLK